MRQRWNCLGLMSVSVLCSALTGADGQVGPDLIAGDIQSYRLWDNDDFETAYSLGRTACNLGDVAVDWSGQPNHNHPVSGGNLFRLSGDGRFEQIGYQWLVHHFCAVQQNQCAICNGGGGCQSFLHPGCSSPNSSVTGGSQGGLGPKWQVNPHTGSFVLPWEQGEGTSGSFRRRLRVRNEDIDPAMNQDARYFAEQFYIAKDDAAASNANNNASYREVAVTPGNFQLTFVDTVQRTRAAVRAWQEIDPDVTLVDLQVDADGEADPESGLFDDGRFIVGYKTTEVADSLWRYEYAIFNQNSHRAARVFAVPVPANVDVTDVGFHDVDYHSGDGIDGENFDGTDWPATAVDGAIRWATDTIEANENANALRWGTLYNFRFTADAPPALVTGRLDMFRPGDPAFMPIVLLGPNACPGDLDTNGVIEFADLLAMLAAWGDCPPPPDCIADLDASGTVNFSDLLLLLAAWGPCGLE